MVTINQALQERIAKLLKEKGLTYNGLSNLAELSQSTINEFKHGRTKHPTVLTINKISNGFDMTLSEFFNDEIFDKVVINEQKKDK